MLVHARRQCRIRWPAAEQRRAALAARRAVPILAKGRDEAVAVRVKADLEGRAHETTITSCWCQVNQKNNWLLL